MSPLQLSVVNKHKNITYLLSLSLSSLLLSLPPPLPYLPPSPLSPSFLPLSLPPDSLTRSLAQSTERLRDLEQQLEQVLASRSAAVQQLEEQLAANERELHTARERAEELTQIVEDLKREQEDEDKEEEEELETLRESVDSLSQQLTGALEELERAQRQ